MSYKFLCSVPFLAVVLVGICPLRVPGIHQALGIAVFVLICLAAWSLGLRELRTRAEERKLALLAGAMLLTPFALVSLLWVGLGPPWVATPVENRMRYLVLLACSMAVAGGFILLKEALREATEHLYSTLGFAANIFGGAAYLFWLALHVAVYDVKVREEQIPPEIVSLVQLSDILLFAACVLTYLATAAFAASMGRARWLGGGATRAYVTANLIALLLIVVRGLSFPDPTDPMPWYAIPGFVVGIPAIPWIMPCLMGVVLLRRAGGEENYFLS